MPSTSKPTGTSKAPATQAATQAEPARRTKRPTPKRILAVRITPQTDDRLTYANQQTGLGVTGIVERALSEYFDYLGIPSDAKPPLNPDGTRPIRERSVKKRTRRAKEEVDDVPIGPRISEQTDDRLTVACLNMATGPQDIVEVALRAWLMRNGIPMHPRTPGMREEED